MEGRERRGMGASMDGSPFRRDCLGSGVGSPRRCLVTGGTSGIGLVIASTLRRHGAHVAVMGRREEVLRGAVEALRAVDAGEDASAGAGADPSRAVVGIRGDVRDYAKCAEAVSKASEAMGGPIDVVVNCAAGNFLAPAESLSSNGFRTVLEIDTLGTFNMCRAALGSLREAAGRAGGGDACVINISATLQYGATWWQAHASAAKAAVDSLTRSLALEWGAYGVRVNGIAPGPIAGTAGLAKLAPGAESMIAKVVPLGRMGDKEDIALACVYLASRAGRYVTGDTLVVDGGHWLWKPPAVPRDKVVQASKGVEASSRATGVPGAKARSKL